MTKAMIKTVLYCGDKEVVIPVHTVVTNLRLCIAGHLL